MSGWKINEVLEGHVGLDLECWDRIYLNAYVPSCRWQVTAFRRTVGRFADAEHIPAIRFGRGDRKIEKMRPHLAAQAATGRSGGQTPGGEGGYRLRRSNGFATTDDPAGLQAICDRLDPARRVPVR